MMENIDDANAVEPVANALEGMDLNEAVEDAINKNDNDEVSGEELYEEDNMAEEEKIIEKMVEEETTKEKEQEANSILSDDTTYITKGTTIKGSIETDGGIDVIGAVEGDVTCGGKLIIGGSIEGNINAGEIYANAAKIKGEITTEGSVKIGVGTVVVGNISATSAVIAGAINGDIDVHGPVIVDSTAVIMGDIKSRSVQINNGAVIEGRCSQCYSEIDVKSFFE
ncbi:MAG: polymer-forming cytoskeletal protein [Lachnospiraceae bacterium]|nr:polymer-forming cytoskeletal protein [Lachnospiraceae bacterium]